MDAVRTGRHAGVTARSAAEEVEELRAALVTRAEIGQAVGCLIAWYRIDAEAAWHAISRVSQNSNVKVVALAAELVAQASGTASSGASAAVRSAAAQLLPHRWPAGRSSRLAMSDRHILAEVRDRRAEERDAAAERRDAKGRARHESTDADDDRSSARQDREAAARDRHAAAGDRDDEAADSSAGQP
jgi:hypothetical protein